MLELPEYMTWNMYLKQHAKYVMNYGKYAQFFYSERAVINFLHQNHYRWRNVKSLGNGEWETKDKRIKIRKVYGNGGYQPPQKLNKWQTKKKQRK